VNRSGSGGFGTRCPASSSNRRATVRSLPGARVARLCFPAPLGGLHDVISRASAASASSRSAASLDDSRAYRCSHRARSAAFAALNAE
jgi:hypothetical protein